MGSSSAARTTISWWRTWSATSPRLTRIWPVSGEDIVAAGTEA
jgi:hypothetical protein